MTFLITYRNQVRHFFNLLDEKNLLLRTIESTKSSSNEFEPINYHYQIRSGITKLIDRTDKIVDDEFSETEFSELLMLLRAYGFAIRLEYIKDTLVKMLNKKKFPTNIKNKPLGNVIEKINNLLYPHSSNSKEETNREKLRRLNYELFFVSFRNAIIHSKYKLDNVELFYNDHEGKQININPKKLQQMISKLILLNVRTDTKYRELTTKD